MLTTPDRQAAVVPVGTTPLTQWTCGPCGLESDLSPSGAESSQLAGVHDGIHHGGQATAEVTETSAMWERYLFVDVVDAERADVNADEDVDDDGDGWW